MRMIVVFTSLFICGISLSLSAQNSMDIGLSLNAANELEVKLRPSADFDGVVSALAFTIRWERGSGAIIDEGIPSRESLPFFQASKSGETRSDGNWNYQVFAGFGMVPMSTVGSTWMAGEEYTILRIPVVGDASFEIINDQWTGELANNGDFYVSLSGVDHTGVIYREQSFVPIHQLLSVHPNPNTGQFQLDLQLEGTEEVVLEFRDELGRLISADAITAEYGQFSRSYDIRNEPKGVYVLTLIRRNSIKTLKVFVQ